MRIAEISVYSHALPVKDGPYRYSGNDLYSLDTTLVKIVADNGLVGWGETCPLGPIYQPHHAVPPADPGGPPGARLRR
jgi:L-alanine-DL-glutamate epimerase-like enolase superfamily enzyme